MSAWRAGAWWLGFTLLAPVALPLAVYTRRKALRLPPAAGLSRGVSGQALPGEPLRLLVLGESTVVGVGVDQLQAALVGQLALALAVREGRPVAWRACGENGITAEQARERLLPQVLGQPFDLALLVFGVNDTTHLTSLARWEAALGSMAEALVARGAAVAFSSVPPLQHFTALPWLLRRLLGLRAGLLDTRLRQLAVGVGASHHTVDLEFSAEYLARDGYHPSSLGYRVWAQGLAVSLAPAARCAP
ncbi:SGNH/GDSL hydrolase family protein [Pseudomonas sp. MIL19]|uniref:SGNH/GDSL hydrolase family protein n=1 Tax=Pseudomonas sp. MIL19 TaxID=2976979 RepID=UPI0023644A34|nr:SGNH/GDSL hydrolase family protein [Pseudomonas sp. MIL19]MBU0882126.1 SGNH/GDSL hydrolase family protein [Gammaproteobacteria bacterium]MBU1859889.1 SGNH/GDSL hydrolase family protein [Gammaproteobacteria bacterium]MDD2159770.1 SGNH/GDSL hydrolase family protein [Pseudomonas sp. MIL19]